MSEVNEDKNAAIPTIVTTDESKAAMYRAMLLSLLVKCEKLNSELIASHLTHEALRAHFTLIDECRYVRRAFNAPEREMETRK